VTFLRRTFCAYNYNRCCCLYAPVFYWFLRSSYGSSNALIRNVRLMTRCYSRGYFRRTSHNCGSKESPNWYASFHRFRNYVLLRFLLSLFPFCYRSCDSNWLYLTSTRYCCIQPLRGSTSKHYDFTSFWMFCNLSSPLYCCGIPNGRNC